MNDEKKDEKTLKPGNFDLLVAVPEEWGERDQVKGVKYYKVSSCDFKEFKPDDPEVNGENKKEWDRLVEMNVHMAHKAYPNAVPNTDPKADPNEDYNGLLVCGTFFVNMAAFRPRR